MPQPNIHIECVREMAIEFLLLLKKLLLSNSRLDISGFSEDKIYLFTVPYFVLMKNEVVDISVKTG